MRYPTVLFDLDGTLVDTNNLILQSFLHTLEHYFPGKYTVEDILPYMGQTLFQQMERYGGKELVQELVDHYREYNVRMHDDLIEEFPYVLEVIPQLAKAGVTLGIVTTKMRKTAVMGLQRYGIESFFSTVITYESTTEHKPYPAPVLTAMEELGAKPEHTLMVGDSEYDILAGQRAGVDTAGVAWSLKGEAHLQTFNPTYMLRDIRDILPIVKGD
jgi:pyrophosphatase PpaX